MGLISKRLRYGFVAGIFIATMSMTSLLAFPQKALAFAGGDGSWEDPYQVANCTQLQQVYNFDDYNNFYDKNYILTANINCSAVDEFFPLYDNNEYVFSGTFDGQGFTISNLNISGSDYQAGLFGYSYGATFKNFKLKNVAVDHTSHDEAGALVGYAINTQIEDVHATNVNVSGRANIGGLIGVLETTVSGDSDVERASATGSVTGTGANAGGLVGRMMARASSSNNVSESYANVDITASDAHVGGLVGSITTDNTEDSGLALARVIDTYAWTDISAPNSDNVGGLVGSVTRSGTGETRLIVRQSYAWTDEGSVTGRNTIGGLIGLIRNFAGDGWYAVEDNFALAAVVGESNLGGLVGINQAPEGYLDAYYNHYDVEIANLNVCDSGQTLTDDIDEEGEGTYACMPQDTENSEPNYFINNSSNAPMNDWDFEEVWVVRANTPPVFHSFVEEPGDEEEPKDDSDSDGIDSEIEDAAPNDGDANNDGIPDSEQSNVASFVNTTNNKYVSVSLADGCEITNAIITTESNEVKDGAYDYKSGLVNFSANCNASSTTATIYQYGIGVDGLTLRKHNPSAHSYFSIENATITSQSIGGQQVVVATYTVEDNGPLDLDPDTGQITDPVGLASLVVGAPNTGIQTVSDLLFVRRHSK